MNEPRFTVKRETIFSKYADEPPYEKVTIVTKTPPYEGNWKEGMDFEFCEVNCNHRHRAQEIADALNAHLS